MLYSIHTESFNCATGELYLMDGKNFHWHAPQLVFAFSAEMYNPPNPHAKTTKSPCKYKNKVMQIK